MWAVGSARLTHATGLLLKGQMMQPPQFITVHTASGQFEAEIIRSLLEAQGLTVRLSQESAGAVYAFTVGPLGEVEVMVPENEVVKAREVLEAYARGEFNSDEEVADGDDVDSSPTS